MIRTKYSNREKVLVMCEEESLAQPQFKNDLDINKIMERANGRAPIVVQKLNPKYGDFSGIEDYQSSLQKVAELHDEFDNLPAQVKKRFSQDPGEILDFLSNENNREEAIRMGLIQKEPDPITEPQGEPPEAPNNEPVGEH